MTDTQFSLLTDYMWLRYCVKDEYDALTDSEIKRNESLERLKVIKGTLDVAKQSQEELLDFYCQDPNFAAIVGTSDRYRNLCEFIDRQEQEVSNENVIILGGAAALGLISGSIAAIIKELCNNNRSYIKNCLRHRTAWNTLPFSSTKFRYKIKANDVIKATKTISSCINDINNWIKNPKTFDKSKLEQSCKKIHIDLTEPSIFDKLKAATIGTLKSVIDKGLIHGVPAGFGQWLGMKISNVQGDLGLMLVAGFIAGSSGGVIGDMAERYRRELNNISGESTLASLGWSANTLLDLANTLDELFGDLEQLESSIKDNKESFESEDDLKACKGYLTLLVHGTKAINKIFIEVFRSVHKTTTIK